MIGLRKYFRIRDLYRFTTQYESDICNHIRRQLYNRNQLIDFNHRQQQLIFHNNTYITEFKNPTK